MIKKIIVKTLLTSFSILSILILLIVFTSYPKTAQHTVTIKAPIDEVWAYNADNRNARNWSVYFYSIEACPIHDCPNNQHLSPMDIGYVRRCYRNQDKSGVFWDEVTTEINQKPNQYYRQIISYNFNGFPDLLDFNSKGEFLVEQIYHSLNINETELTFKTSFVERKSLKHTTNLIQYRIWRSFFNFITLPIVEKIFQQNLINIKAAIEQKENYQAIYPYDPDPNAFKP
jgi:hypothetical protein